MKRGPAPSRMRIEYATECALPAPPAYLSDRAKEIWLEIGTELATGRLITTVDRLAFAKLCDYEAKWEASITKAQNAGTDHVMINGQLCKEPNQARADEIAKTLRQWLGEFGMTPATRSSVKPLVATNASNALQRFQIR